MNELFEIPESKSPRLLWMERHHLTVRLSHDHDDEDVWQCLHGMKVIGEGSTQDKAITAAAKSLNIPLWNEVRP